jgi:hypothetical protein
MEEKKLIPISLRTIAILFLITESDPIDFKIFEQVVGQVSRGLSMLFAAFIFAYSLCQLYVLTRSDIKELFQI